MQLRIASAVILVFLISAGCDAGESSFARTETVRQVVDGDTVELTDGTRVRYIGVDAPEVRRRAAGRWIYDPQRFAIEAADFNKSLVAGRQVRLVLDQEKQDRFGRLLAYVFLEDGTFVNERLLRRGLAKLLVIAPNTLYADRLEQAQETAKEKGVGIWQ